MNTHRKCKTVIFLITFCLLCTISFAFQIKETVVKRHRLIILADMGNEHDEMQQNAHLLTCSNEFDIEGLIAVTGKFKRKNTEPELYHLLINAYGKVEDNLKLHADGWQTASYLRSIISSGQKFYGMADVGKDKSSLGSELIIKVLKKDDPRPLYVVVNGGSNTLAQALWDLKETNSEEEVSRLVKKLIVFENGAQDDAGAWICHTFPEVFWMRSNYQTYSYGGPGNVGEKFGPYTWKPYEYSFVGQHLWAVKNIISGHGALLMEYPLRLSRSPQRYGQLSFIEGGGTVPWLNLTVPGLTDVEKPWWGGWSGRFSKEKVSNYWSRLDPVKETEENYKPFSLFKEDSDQWTDTDDGTVYNDIYAPVYRWRQAFFNDFKCRADWSVNTYEECNHHPIAKINGDKGKGYIVAVAKAGETISLDASASSDPDGDKLFFSWWIYKEAGTYQESIPMNDTNKDKINFKIPDNAAGSQIHLILEIKDNNKIASLYAYRRIVIDVE